MKKMIVKLVEKELNKLDKNQQNVNWEHKKKNPVNCEETKVKRGLAFLWNKKGLKSYYVSEFKKKMHQKTITILPKKTL